MTWCKDTARDAAVRAAEDNRTEPLPTLGEAIAAPFACTSCGGFGMDHRCRESCKECDGSGRAMFPKSVSASSAVDHENKGDGMRTERITLEVTGAPGWRVHVNGIDVESVRVVEEPESTDLRHRWDRDGERCLKCRDKDWMGGPCSTTDDEYIAALTAERDAAIRERQKLEARLSRVLKSSDSMWSQILVVGAERDKLRARVAELEGCSWVPKAELDALQARVAELEAASGGNPPETPDGSSQAAKPELPTD